MILIILIHLSYLGVGLVAIRLLFKHEDYPCHLRLAMSYFVGVFIHVFILHMAIVVTMTSPAISWFLLVIGLLGLIYEIWFVIKTRSIRVNIVSGSKKILILNASIVVLLIPVIYLITLKLLSVPDISYDTTAVWNLKAKYFFYGDHLWTDAFTDTNRLNVHRNYPLYMPIFTFEHYSILGVADDFLTKPGTWIYYFAGMVLFFLLIRQWAGTTVALLAIAFMLYSPVYSWRSIQGSITTTYIDFPLSLMIAVSAGQFLRYLCYRSSVDFFCAMVSVSSALLLKQEGIAWFALFVILALISMLFTHKKLWCKEYAWLALPVSVSIAWYLIRANIVPGGQIGRLTLEQLYSMYGVFPKMLNAWLLSIINFRLWGLFPFFVIPAFVIGLFRNLLNLQILVIFFMVLGYLTAIFFAIMLIDIQTGRFDYFMLRGYERFIIHILPISFLLAIITNSRKFKGLIKGSDEIAIG